MFTNHQINIFLSLCETESFSKTASLFNISRQSVCKTLTNMENDLDCILFAREGRSLKLNETGQFVKDYMNEETRLFNIFSQKLEEMKNLNKPTFTIGLQTHLMLKPESLAVTLFLNESNDNFLIRSDRGSPNRLINGLENHEFDLIILCDSLVEKKTNFLYKKLRDVDIIMQVSRSNPLLTETSTAKSFASTPFVIDRFENETELAFRKRVRNELNRFSLSPSRLVEAENADSVYLNIIVGNCISLSTTDGWYVSSPRIKTFITGEKDSLICMWRKKDSNPLIAKFIATAESFIKK